MVRITVLAFILLTTCTAKIDAQLVVIKVGLGACTKCYSPLVSMQDYQKKYPVIVSLDPELRTDSLEVERLYRFRKLGYPVTYSKVIYDKLLNELDGFFLIDHDLNILAKAQLLPFDVEAVNALFRSLDSLAFKSAGGVSSTAFSYPNVYEYVRPFNRLKASRGNEISNYAVDAVVKKRILSHLELKGVDTTTTEDYRNFIHDQPLLDASYKAYFVRNSELFLLAKIFLMSKTKINTLEPFLIINRIDEIGKEQFTMIDLSTVPRGYAISEFDFIITPNQDFIASFVAVPEDSPNPYLGLFIKDETTGNYSFKKVLNFTLPPVFHQSFAYNLTPMSAKDYPYVQITPGP